MLERDLNFISNKLYTTDENGNRQHLLAEDSDFAISEITHPKVTITQMGNREYSDYTRVDNFTCTFTLPQGAAMSHLVSDSNGNIIHLCATGRQQRIVNGLMTICDTTIYCTGGLTGLPAVSLALEQSGGASITLDCYTLLVTYRPQGGDEIVLHNIDTFNNVLIWSGKNYREGLNET